MNTQAQERDDYDNPWKQILEAYFAPFMAFFFPVAYDGIDWSRGYVFLDKELQQITRDAEVTGRTVDKLVKVWKRNGEETWLLIHIEIQSQEDSSFPERMFVYYYRIYDRYRRPIESLAILGDDRPNWRPAEFQPEVVWETALNFRFRSIKLLDYQPWEVLEASSNPFATVVMAHLKTLETKHDTEGRLQWKLALIRRLYERGLARADILRLFHFLDWLMWLPEELTTRFWQTLHTYEEERKMPYITSVERLGKEQGRAEGRIEGRIEGRAEGRIEGRAEERLAIVVRQLTRRCGTLSPEITTQIEQLTMPQLEALTDALLDFAGMDDLHTWLQNQPPAE